MATIELYLIRHGIAEERGPEWPDDSKRPLTGKGITALKQEAKALAALGISFDLIISSPLMRTRQTANVFAECPWKLSRSSCPRSRPSSSVIR